VKVSKLWMVLPSFLLFLVCAKGQDVHYNYDRSANFGSYKTYSWVDQGRPQVPSDLPNPPAGLPSFPGAPIGGSTVSDDQLLEQDIERAVDAQLAAKGLTKVEQGGDLLVGYKAQVNEEKSINLFGSGWGGGPWGGWGGWGGGLSSMSLQGQTSTVPIGTLVVGLYDPARKQMVWRGDASKTVYLKKDANKNYQQLEKAVAKLFKNYPPPGK